MKKKGLFMILFTLLLVHILWAVNTPSVRTEVSPSGKVGLSSDAGHLKSKGATYFKDVFLNNGFKVGMFWLGFFSDTTLGGKSTEVTRIKEFASLMASSDPECEIWVDFVPNYGFDTSWWWTRLGQTMDEFNSYSNVKRFGLYIWEFFAKDGGKESGDLSGSEVASYLDQFASMSNSRGKDHYFWTIGSVPGHGLTNRWNLFKQWSSNSVFGFGLGDIKQSWDSPPDSYHISVGLGVWNYDTGAQWGYTYTKNLLKALDAGWQYVFLISEAEPHKLWGIGARRAIRERVFNEYVSPADGKTFSSQNDLDSYWKSNYPFLTINVSPVGQKISGDFTIQATITNIGSQTAKTVSVLLQLESRQYCDSLSPLVQMLGDISAGSSKTAQWNINVFAGSKDDYVAYKVLAEDGTGQYDSHYNDIFAGGHVTFDSTFGTKNRREYREVRAFSGSTEVNVNVDVYLRREKNHWKSQSLGIKTTPFIINTYYLVFLYTSEDTISRWTVEAEIGIPEYFTHGPSGMDIRLGNYTPPPPPQTANLRGIVVDNSTGTPIEGASVTANVYSTTTNSIGQYSFNVSFGVYDLTITKSGYETWTGQVNASTADIYIVDAQLIPSPPQVYTLTITTSLGGTTDPTPGAHTYNEGTVIIVTAYPNSGYFLNHWELDGANVGVDNPYSLTLNSDHILHAVFSTVPPTTYSLTINSTTGGTTNPSPGIHLFNEDSNASVTAAPDVDYIFENWELDGRNVGNANPYRVFMDGNHTLRAIFSLRSQSTITGTVTDSITGAPISEASINANEYSNVSNSDGSYFLEVSPSVYTLTVSMVAYENWSDSVDVSVAGIYRIDVFITPEKTANGTLFSIAVQIQDQSTHEAISNATVYIKNDTWTSQIKYTDSTGWANFTMLESGTYLAVVSAEGYATAIETVSSITNAVYSIKISRSSSAAMIASVPEFNLLIATSLGAIAYFLIQRKFENKKQKINKRLRQNYNR